VFCAWALVGFLCILVVYLEAYCAFLIIQFYLLIKKKMSNEVFQEVLPPPFEGHNCIDQDIAVINETVTLILPCNFDIELNVWTEIWVLNECGVETTWTKILTIRQIPVFLDLLQLREDGLVVLIDADQCLVLYDPRTQEARNLQIYEARSAQLVSYTESLVLLNGEGMDVLEQQAN
jgi:hypothetical protein